jgi:hypothetical protein
VTTSIPVNLTPDIRELALQVARALDNPDAWCRGAFARDARGERVYYYNAPYAVRWCALGQAYRLCGLRAAHILSSAYAARFRATIPFDNDHRERGREYVRDRLLELAHS